MGALLIFKYDEILLDLGNSYFTYTVRLCAFQRTVIVNEKQETIIKFFSFCDLSNKVFTAHCDVLHIPTSV
jgi:hypothetical protein